MRGYFAWLLLAEFDKLMKILLQGEILNYAFLLSLNVTLAFPSHLPVMLSETSGLRSSRSRRRSRCTVKMGDKFTANILSRAFA